MQDQPSRAAPSADNGPPQRSMYENSHSGTDTVKESPTPWNALVDRGANGCIAGRDMRVIERTERTIDLSGIDDHTVRNLTIVSAGGVVRTQKGDVVLVVHQAADMTRDSKTILSCGQMEHFGCTVNEKPKQVSGRTPYIMTIEGYKFPITIRKGLPYLQMRPYRDTDWENLPHVAITSPQTWNPAVMDSTVKEQWYQKQPQQLEAVVATPIDPEGNLKEDLEDNGDDDGSDRNHQAIDRGMVRSHFTETILDEMNDGYIICEADGELYDIDYDMDAHGEYYGFEKPSIECFPTTRASTRKSTQKSRERRKSRRRGNQKKIPQATPVTVPEMLDDDEPPELVKRQGTSSSDSESDEEPRTDSNNPARTMEVPSQFARPSKRNLERYTKYFPGANVNSIRKTFDATTQLGTRGAVKGMNLRNRIVAPNPVLNIPRRNEDVATDTLYSDTPAVDDGSTAAQFFIGRKSQFRTVSPMGPSDKNFPNALMDQIRRYGAMDRLVSDNARAEISARVKEILRTLVIDDWQSEPYKGNQNYSERGWRDTKTRTNNLLNFSGAPPEVWLLALMYVCFVQNHTAFDSLNGRTPTEWLLGYTPDIMVLLQFHFWEPVFYAKYDGKFPGDSTECLGRFVGIAENVGNAMTFKVLTENNKVICRSVIRSALSKGGHDNKRAKDKAPNLAPPLIEHDGRVNKEKTISPIREAPGKVVPETVEEGNSDTEDNVTTNAKRTFIHKAKEDILYSKREKAVEEGKPLPVVDISRLLGRTFINNPDDEGVQL